MGSGNLVDKAGWEETLQREFEALIGHPLIVEAKKHEEKMLKVH